MLVAHRPAVHEYALLFPRPAMDINGTLLAHGITVLEATEEYTIVWVVDTARVQGGEFAVVAPSNEEDNEIGKIVLSPPTTRPL